MTSTSCRSAALDCIIAPWAAKIAAFLAAIVETILAIAANNRNILQGLGFCCRKAGRRCPALRPGLSRPMMSKLAFLPPSASVLHALARIWAGRHDGSARQERRIDQRAVHRALSYRALAQAHDLLIPPALNDDNGSERRICPHVKNARRFGRFVNPLSATETSGVIQSIWKRNLRSSIHEPLYRLDASRTTSGSGLGLSLVAVIAALHGIAITLTDNETGIAGDHEVPQGRASSDHPSNLIVIRHRAVTRVGEGRLPHPEDRRPSHAHERQSP
jgi:hypothetical protein